MDFCYLCARIFPRNPDPDSMRQGIFSYESSDGYLKTFATDDYCLENPNLWMYRTLIFFCAYCTVDLLLCLILVNDHKG